jgi:hypothetical protein
MKRQRQTPPRREGVTRAGGYKGGVRHAASRGLHACFTGGFTLLRVSHGLEVFDFVAHLWPTKAGRVWYNKIKDFFWSDSSSHALDLNRDRVSRPSRKTLGRVSHFGVNEWQ